jgi:hypothetical protein
MDCKIVKCTCKHEFQDETYGKGMRVYNPAGDKQSGGRCTVCGAVIGSAHTRQTKRERVLNPKK